MDITGKYTETLKLKAIKEATQMMECMYKGNANELWEYTQLSWRFHRKKVNLLGININYKQYKNADKNLYIPQFDKWEIQHIHFHTPIMIDVIVLLGKLGQYRIRMIAEKKPYVTNPDAQFRYNPNSLRNIIKI
jgi:hypothetical protein